MGKDSIIRRNRKVVEARGDSWRKKVVQGKYDAKTNPSVLCQQRVKKGLTQTELANEIEVSLSSYGAIERGARPVKGLIAFAIAKKLRMNTDELFDAEDKKFIAKKIKN